MGKLIATNRHALRFLMTEDLYDVKESVRPAPFNNQAQKIKNPGNKVVEPQMQSEPAAPLQAQAPIAEAETTTAGNINDDVSATSFDYLGENNRYFLIVVRDESHTQLNAAHKDMLMKIMAAKKLELRDLAILNLAKYPHASFGQLKEFFSCSKIALFGIDPRQIALPAIGANEPAKHHEVKVLSTFSLEEMSTSIDKKRQFWNVMKDF